SVQIRNMGTIGGNLCNASPAADTAPPLLALDAEARIAGPAGARQVPLEEFFVGPGRTVLGAGEILVEVSVPHLPEGAGASFMKMRRTSVDIALVNVAAVLKLEGGVVADCRAALGSVAPTPVRAHRAEDSLKGREPTDEALERAAYIASEEISPITDLRATAEYRRAASRALLRDALTIAKRRIEEGMTI
ncbi:MAG: FAD binding domain-containing protein, partial [Candidatus Bathyarchaeia archaeon]